jgi:hypothetical protein
MMGFDDAVLYINEIGGVDRMRPRLQAALCNGSLRLVDWGWPEAPPFHDQPPNHMSCLWRAKGRYRWLGLNDFDEFYITPPGRTVRDVLADYDPMGLTIGGVACCNRWFQGTGILAPFKCATACVGHRHRQKAIVRPEAVDYYYVHLVVVGQTEHFATENELFIGHFRQGDVWPVGIYEMPYVNLSGNCRYLEGYRSEIMRWMAFNQSQPASM